MPARRLPPTAVLPLALIGLAVAPAAGQALAPPTNSPLALVQTPPPAARPPHVLTTNADGFLTRLGPVRVATRTSSLARAYAAFGRPSASRGTGSLRRVRWATAGVSIVGLTLGGCRNPDRCRTSELRIQTARVTGPRWQTAAGLKVGDPAARIPALYPEATAPPADGSGDVVVAHAYSPIGDGGDIPILTARVRGGLVSGFDV